MLHEQLRERVRALGITQSEAARRCGLSDSYLSDLMTQKRGKRIGLETVRKLENGLKASFFSSRSPQRRK